MENQTKKWTYLVIDLEMTGLNPFKHGVIEVGMMALDKNFAIIGEFFMDLCPPTDVVIDAEALKYNGFTLERIAMGRPYEEFVEFFANFFQAHFSEEKKPIIVGQYVAADLAFLASIFHHARKSSLFLRLWNDILDTKSMANQANAIARHKNQPLPFPVTSLSKRDGLSQKLGVKPYIAHTARGDILATREVLLKFLGIDTEIEK